MYKVTLLCMLACTLACAAWAADAPGQPTTAPPLPKTKINPKDGAEMVLVPAGEFLMGASEEQLAAWLKADPKHKREDVANELPQRTVYLDAYYVYKTEVTVAQYRKFCAATKRKMPEPPRWGWQETHPMVCVSWVDAKAYADWAEATLPTEAQWEKAARGTDGRVFPWGNDWDATRCANWTNSDGMNDNPISTHPVGSFPTGVSPYGCLDMAGNVWEWCADCYKADYYKTAPAKNPPGPSEMEASPVNIFVVKDGKLLKEQGKARVLRGGGWLLTDPTFFRTFYRCCDGPTYGCYNDGFRCVCRVPGP